MLHRTLISQVLLLVLGLCCLPAAAQVNDAPVKDELIIPADELDRGTPLRSAEGFSIAADRRDFEGAAAFGVGLKSEHAEKH